VGLIAGAAGFFGGLFAQLSAAGLDHPGWAPVAMLSGAALLGSVTVALTAKLPGRVVIAVAAATTVCGALLASALRMIGDSYEWVIISAVARITVAAAATPTLARSA
jgi:hypothetical protein